MHVPIETLVLLGYLDSLFAEGHAREVTPLRAVPDTVNRLQADAMREHARPSTLLAREGTEWKPTPDWRLDRHVIRVALYLRERLGVEPGDRVALLAGLQPEWLIADLAGLGLGAVSVAIDPRLQRDELTTALEDAAPRVTFASASALSMLESLDGRAPPHGQLIALDPVASGGDAMPLQVLLEMGGTLDTPERAQAYRADARSLGPERPALRHYRQAPAGGWERVDLSQGEVIERLRAGWLREPARSGDLAYVSDPTASPAARLALYAFVGDGYTTTALALAGGEPSDLASLGPTKIVAPAALLAEAVRLAGHSGWVRHTTGRDRRDIRKALGGRARWIASLDPLDSALADRLGVAEVVGPAPC
jgi:AMP-binding enzyme